MKKYGIIGHPISHSLSPALFSAGYSGKYKYDLIEGENFEISWNKFIDEYEAINITAPFKEYAFQKCDLYSGPTAVIGATNLVVKTKEGLMAYNSDFSGVILSVAEALFPGIISEFYLRYKLEAHKMIHLFVRKMLLHRYNGIKPQALIVGCGGAGKAAAVAAAEMGFDVAIMNRSLEKAEEISRRLPKYKFIPVPLTDFTASFKECELIIYTLPVKIDAINDLKEEDFRQKNMSKIILEPNYRNPSFMDDSKSAFKESLQRFKNSIEQGESTFEAIENMNNGSDATLEMLMQKAGVIYIPGVNWLLNQAIAGYSLMTGEQPNLRKMNNVFI